MTRICQYEAASARIEAEHERRGIGRSIRGGERLKPGTQLGEEHRLFESVHVLANESEELFGNCADRAAKAADVSKHDARQHTVIARRQVMNVSTVMTEFQRRRVDPSLQSGEVD
jgi:hypothetical protein